MIELNGRPLVIGSGHTLVSILAEVGLSVQGPGIAIAVDGDVIPKGEWVRFVVDDGAKLELVRAVQGG